MSCSKKQTSEKEEYIKKTNKTKQLCIVMPRER